MQYSIFICDLDPMEMLDLKLALGKEIDHRVDSIALIDLGLPTERGKSCFEFLGSAPALPVAGPLIL